jgi:D-tyrosyl-tRNA(Tyr) deacylase
VRVLIQRIKGGSVTTGGQVIATAASGLCLFLGIAKEDTKINADGLAQKIVGLRIFEDDSGKFHHSLSDIKGEILIVSEFTLYGDCSKGKRPSFSRAAPPQEAEILYNYFIQKLKELGLKVATGQFQSKMDVHIINDGPVTFLLEG